MTGLSALLLGHGTVSTADTGRTAHTCPGEYGHMIWTWPIGVFYLPWPPSLAQDWCGDQLGPRAGPHAGIKARGARLLPEGVGLGEVRLQQWEGREVSLGQLVTFLSPSGQSGWPENEGTAEPRS